MAMQTELREGKTAYSRDGEKVGDISEVKADYFVIQKGFIFTDDMYMPKSIVEDPSDEVDGSVKLALTKDEIEARDWSEIPTDGGMETGRAEYGGATTAGAAGTTGRDIDRGTDTDRTIERREERLTVDKEAEKVGEVHVGKRVEEEDRSVDVPVRREEVTMERHDVDRPATGTTDSDEEIEVPVYAEHAEADKEARVVEELEVGKTAETGTERVGGTVRREEFDIDDDTRRR